MAGTTIKLKNSSTAGSVPTTTDIAKAELAINTTDARLYTRDENDNILYINFGDNEVILNDAFSFSNTVDVNASSTFFDADTFALDTFRSAKYLIQATDNTNSYYLISEFLIIHDGSKPYTVQYALAYDNNEFLNITSQTDATNCYLQVSTEQSNPDFTVKIFGTRIKI